VGDEVAAEGVAEWDAAVAGAALGLDGADDRVPAALDRDQVVGEVDVAPAQGP
jgi:hypothetical protein